MWSRAHCAWDKELILGGLKALRDAVRLGGEPGIRRLLKPYRKHGHG
jgi:hypothetical protein